ncbi:MAG: glycosyltransferase family 39 protein [Planctomycetes bacterium]|nr:glycosyltransferase family 39 protein [Planctomycetota bacterium]
MIPCSIVFSVTGVLTIVGAWLLMAALPSMREESRFARFVLGGVVGMAWHGLGVALAVALGAPYALTTSILVLGAAVGSAVAIGGRGVLAAPFSPRKASSLRGSSTHSHGPAIVVALVGLLAIGLAWHDGAGFIDARTIWMLKARVLAIDGGVGGSFFTDWHDWTERRSYPLLVPVHFGLHHLVRGGLDDAALKIGHACVALGVLLMVALRMTTRGAPQRATFAVVVVAVSTISLTAAMWANADVFVAVFTLAALEFADRALEDGRPRGFVALGIVLGALVATKNEGVVPAVAIALVTIVRLRSRREHRAVAWFGVLVLAAPAMAHVAVWHEFVCRHGFVDSLWRQSVWPGVLSDGAVFRARASDVLDRLVAELLSTRWLFVWPLGVGVALARPRRMLRAPETLVVLAVLLALVVLLLFVARDPRWLQDTAVARVLSQVFPVAIVLVLVESSPRARTSAVG